MYVVLDVAAAALVDAPVDDLGRVPRAVALLDAVHGSHLEVYIFQVYMNETNS